MEGDTYISDTETPGHILYDRVLEKGQALCPTVLGTLQSEQVVDIKKTCTQSYAYTMPLYIPEKLSQSEQSMLMDKYGHFNLNFTRKSNNSHGMAAAVRKCEQLTLFIKSGVKPVEHYQVDSGKDFVLTDIGGNFVDSLVNNWPIKNIHYCCPIIDFIDSNRNTKRFMRAKIFDMNQRVKTPNQQEILMQINNFRTGKGSHPFVCNKRGENCDVQTSMGIALHSLYDIPPYVLGDMMDKKGIDIVNAVMQFDSWMLLATRGELEDIHQIWEMDWKNKQVSFTYKNDSSFKYVHKLDVYLAWFLYPAFLSSSGSRFMVESQESLFGSTYLQITRVADPIPFSSTEVSLRRWTLLDKYMIIKWEISYIENLLRANGCFQADMSTTLSTKLKTNGYAGGAIHNISKSFEETLMSASGVHKGDKFKTVSLLIDKEVYDKVMSFALSASDKRFVYSEVYGFLRSVVSALIIGKEIVIKGSKVDPRLDYMMALAIYITAWDFKYSMGVETKNTMTAIEYNRSLAERSIMGKLLSFNSENSIFAPFTRAYRRVDRWVYKAKRVPYVDSRKIVQTPPGYVDIGMSIDNRTFKFWSRGKEITIKDFPGFGSLGEHPDVVIESMNLLAAPANLTVSDFNTLHCNIPTHDFLNFLDYAKILWVINNHKDISKKKVSKAFIKLFEDETYLEMDYMVHPLIDEFIVLFSKFFLIKTDLKVKNGRIILCLDYKVNKPKRLVRSVVNDIRVKYHDILGKVLFSAFIEPVIYSECRDINLPEYVGDIISVKNSVVKPSVMRSSESLAMTKLKEMDEYFKHKLVKCLPNATIIDLCAGPGSWTTYATQVNDVGLSLNDVRIITASATNNGKMNMNVDKPGVYVYERTVESFDMENNSDTEALIKYINKMKTKLGVELVMADGGIDGSYPDQERRCLKLFSNELSVIKAVLNRGGRCVVKLYIGETTDVPSLFCEFARHFKSCELIKPLHSNLANGEVYMVCGDYCALADTSEHLRGIGASYLGWQNYIAKFNLNRLNYIFENCEIPPAQTDNDDKGAIISVSSERIDNNSNDEEFDCSESVNSVNYESDTSLGTVRSISVGSAVDISDLEYSSYDEDTLLNPLYKEWLKNPTSEDATNETLVDEEKESTVVEEVESITEVYDADNDVVLLDVITIVQELVSSISNNENNGFDNNSETFEIIENDQNFYTDENDNTRSGEHSKLKFSMFDYLFGQIYTSNSLTELAEEVTCDTPRDLTLVNRCVSPNLNAVDQSRLCKPEPFHENNRPKPINIKGYSDRIIGDIIYENGVMLYETVFEDFVTVETDKSFEIAKDVKHVSFDLPDYVSESDDSVSEEDVPEENNKLSIREKIFKRGGATSSDFSVQVNDSDFGKRLHNNATQTVKGTKEAACQTHSKGIRSTIITIKSSRTIGTSTSDINDKTSSKRKGSNLESPVVSLNNRLVKETKDVKSLTEVEKLPSVKIIKNSDIVKPKTMKKEVEKVTSDNKVENKLESTLSKPKIVKKNKEVKVKVVNEAECTKRMIDNKPVIDNSIETKTDLKQVIESTKVGSPENKNLIEDTGFTLVKNDRKKRIKPSEDLKVEGVKRSDLPSLVRSTNSNDKTKTTTKPVVLPTSKKFVNNNNDNQPIMKVDKNFVPTLTFKPNKNKNSLITGKVPLNETITSVSDENGSIAIVGNQVITTNKDNIVTSIKDKNLLSYSKVLQSTNDITMIFGRNIEEKVEKVEKKVNKIEPKLNDIPSFRKNLDEYYKTLNGSSKDFDYLVEALKGGNITTPVLDQNTIDNSNTIEVIETVELTKIDETLTIVDEILTNLVDTVVEDESKNQKKVKQKKKKLKLKSKANSSDILVRTSTSVEQQSLDKEPLESLELLVDNSDIKTCSCDSDRRSDNDSISSQEYRRINSELVGIYDRMNQTDSTISKLVGVIEQLLKTKVERETKPVERIVEDDKMETTDNDKDIINEIDQRADFDERKVLYNTRINNYFSKEHYKPFSQILKSKERDSLKRLETDGITAKYDKKQKKRLKSRKELDKNKFGDNIHTVVEKEEPPVPVDDKQEGGAVEVTMDYDSFNELEYSETEVQQNNMNYVKVTRLNGSSEVFSCVYSLPDLKEVRTIGDGNCLFWSLADEGVTPKVYKTNMLKSLHMNRVFVAKSTEAKEKILNILNSENKWGDTDIISLHVVTYPNERIFEFSNGIVILHGNVESPITKYVMYRKNHFSKLVTINNVPDVIRTNIVDDNFNPYREYYRDTPIVCDEEALKSHEGFNIYVCNYHNLEDLQESGFLIRRIKHIVRTGDMVAVERGYARMEDVGQCINLIKTHVQSCVRCCFSREDPSKLCWFHNSVRQEIMFKCGERNNVVSAEKVDFCDLVLEFENDVAPVAGTLLKTRKIGRNHYKLGLLTSFISDELGRELLVRTYNSLDIEGMVHTVGYLGVHDKSRKIVYEFLTENFDTMYYVPTAPDSDESNYSPKFIPSVTFEGYLTNSATEIKECYRITKSRVLSDCMVKLNNVKMANINHISIDTVFNPAENNVGLFSIRDKKWIIKPRNKVYRFMFGFNEIDCIASTYEVEKEWKSLETSEVVKEMERQNVLWGICTKHLEVFLEPCLYNAIRDREIFPGIVGKLNVSIIQGVPGAGKTHYILSKHVFSTDMKEVVLTATRAAALDLRKRIAKRYNIKEEEKFLKTKYATLESVMLHVDRYSNVETMYIDEAFLKHLGQCVWVATLLKVKNLILVGDAAQIPYTDRNGLSIKYASVNDCLDKITNVEFLNVSHRVPRDVAFTLNTEIKKVDGYEITNVYPTTMTTSNEILRSMRVEYIAGESSLSGRDADVYLTFTQAEKTKVINFLGKKANNKVFTVNEYQGQESKDVILIRLSIINNDIYDNHPQILTAISRHRSSFVYMTVNVNDTLSNIINKVKDQYIPDSIYTPKKGGAYVYNSARNRGELETRLKPRLGGIDLNPENELVMRSSYFVAENKEDVTLAEICTRNFEGGGYRSAYVISEKSYLEFEKPRMEVIKCHEYDSDVSDLQYWMDIIRTNASTMDRRYQAELFECSDQYIQCDGMKISSVNFSPKIMETMTPLLRTSHPIKTTTTQKSTLKAFNERNGAAKPLIRAVITDQVVRKQYETFKRTYFREDYPIILETFKKEQIRPNIDGLTNWLTTQPPGVFDDLKHKEETTLINSISNIYSYMLKNSAKPKLEKNPHLEFASPQAIAFQDKLVNSVFCPLIQEMKHRIQILLKDNWCMYTDMSVSDFEDILSKNFPPNLLEKVKKKIEIDFSKYDRSQLEGVLMFESIVMESMGIPPEIVKLWCYIHRTSVLMNRQVGFKAYVEYQRKSGDAMTFLGNTLFLMLVLCILLGDKMEGGYGLFSGDDSLLFLKQECTDMVDIFTRASDMFNMEMKLIKSKTFYFCSRFLLPCNIDGRWYIVPDVLKSLIKLGRCDVLSKEHAEQYQISLKDNLINLQNQALYQLIDVSMADRYGLMHSCSHLYSTMWNFINREDYAERSFYWHENDTPKIRTILPILE